MVSVQDCATSSISVLPFRRAAPVFSLPQARLVLPSSLSASSCHHRPQLALIEHFLQNLFSFLFYRTADPQAYHSRPAITAARYHLGMYYTKNLEFRYQVRDSSLGEWFHSMLSANLVVYFEHFACINITLLFREFDYGIEYCL